MKGLKDQVIAQRPTARAIKNGHTYTVIDQDTNEVLGTGLNARVAWSCAEWNLRSRPLESSAAQRTEKQP